MITLDDRQVAIQRQGREWAAELREHALDLDRDPSLVRQLAGLPYLEYMAYNPIPPEFAPAPATMNGHRVDDITALELIVFIEEIACGDVGMMLAAPGPSMCGTLVGLLGDREQQEWFFERVLDGPVWTFFALTEPAHGSDATALETTLSPDGNGDFVLNGAKRYVGNAARAEVGVVFARTRPGPLGITAALVETSAPGFTAEPIPTVGLRGAQITAITLDSVPVPGDRVLGRHLPPSRRGIWGALQGLTRFRPGVAAFSLGIARAALEYAKANRRQPSSADRQVLDTLRQRIDGTRQLIWQAALAVDRGDPNATHLAAASKTRSARLAEEATVAVLDLFGPGARLEHPLLDKLARDGRGVEFMEGTGNVHKLNLFRGLVHGRFDDD
jgi:alkylation response protein AidB-like acyl-CoA dehydrogenase